MTPPEEWIACPEALMSVWTLNPGTSGIAHQP